MRRWICVGLIGLVGAVGGGRLAEASEGGYKLRMAVLLKVLSYDRALTKRAKGKLVITILHKPGVKPSQDARQALTKVLTAAAGVKVQGLAVSVNELAFGEGTLVAGLKKKGTDVLYLTPGLEEAVGSAHAAAKKSTAVTVCEKESLVKAGVAVGVYLRDRRARIAVNLKRARSLGMSLDASLLSLVKVFR